MKKYSKLVNKKNFRKIIQNWYVKNFWRNIQNWLISIFLRKNIQNSFIKNFFKKYSKLVIKKIFLQIIQILRVLLNVEAAGVAVDGSMSLIVRMG